MFTVSFLREGIAKVRQPHLTDTEEEGEKERTNERQHSPSHVLL